MSSREQAALVDTMCSRSRIQQALCPRTRIGQTGASLPGKVPTGNPGSPEGIEKGHG